MPRILQTGLMLTAVIMFAALGCKTREGPPDGNAILLLPASVAPHEDYPERATKLTINGKDEPVTPGGDRELSVKIPSGKTVTIVYDYWPLQYSNTIRTKKVKVEKGATVKVDFHKLDDGVPDQIEPIYVPTPYGVVDEMCKMAKVGKNDIVYDIGCGDGRLVITAVKKFHAKKGVGIDLRPARIKECNAKAAEAGVTDRVEFRQEDALKLKDLSDATVVLLYVGEPFGEVLEPMLRATLKPGARVVSHRFPLGDWEPDETKDFKSKNLSDEDEDYHLKMWTIKAAQK